MFLKKIIYCIVVGISVLCNTEVYSQRGNNWTFGSSIGLNFNTSPPTVFHKNTYGNNYNQSISDCNGKLQLYAHSQYIYIMPKTNY